MKSKGPLRVVVYLRVHADELNQVTSLHLQGEYYRHLVENHAQWKYVGIYTDEPGKETGLNKMLEDAKAGKFDLILVKSFSHLKHNLMESLDIIYDLRNLPDPVGVYLETMSLNSLEKSADYTLQVLYLIAHEYDK